MYVCMPTKGSYKCSSPLRIYNKYYLVSEINTKHEGGWIEWYNSTSISRTILTPMFPISSIINSPSSIIYHEERTIYHISPVKLSPKISRRPLYNAPPQPQPSIFHINTLSWLWRYKFANVLFANVLLIFDILVPIHCTKYVVPSFVSNPNLDISSANTTYID